LFNIIHLEVGVDQVTSTVLLLLSDERLEVREKAAQVLGGLLHCDFLNRDRSRVLLTKFQKQVGRKLPRGVSRTAVVPDVDMALIVERHAGILGLCAFVDAYPYDVPEFLPDILVRLGDHLNDPQPIPVI
jgi:proteasome activator subunit 4